MARPPRIEFPGAWHHVMNRGARHQSIFDTVTDGIEFLGLLEEVHGRFDIQVHAYCLMGNHYHLLVHTPQPTLSMSMHHINSVYTRRFNRRRGIDGPLFRGRFKSILVDADEYLLQLSRYIHRNPLEAGLVSAAADYRWSSLSAYTRTTKRPAWLYVDQVLGTIGGADPRRAHSTFVGHAPPDDDLVAAYATEERTPLILGSAAFAKSVALRCGPDTVIPKRCLAP